MSTANGFRWLFLLPVWICVAFPLTAQSVPEHYAKAQAARDSTDYATYVAELERVAELRPDHPVITYELGVAYLLAGQPTPALDWLARALWIDPDRPLRTDPQLTPLRKTGALDPLYALAEELGREIRHGEPAFTLADTALHPEGVAHSSGSFFLGSVRRGTIVRTTGEGRGTAFAELPAGYSAMGLTVDTLRGWLWVAATATENNQAYIDSLAGRAALLAFDLTTGERVYHAPTPTEAWLGDVIVGPAGFVYATSSSPTDPAIYRTDGRADTLARWLALPELVSLQGLCFDTAGQILFFSDYRYGLFRCDLRTGTVAPLRNATPHPLKGIDGMYYYRGWLVAIHNGLRPFQVTAYRLAADGTAVTDFVYLEKALPEMDEATLGTLVGDWFYYVVNSPWGHYSPEGVLQTQELTPPRVRRVRLSEFCTPSQN